MAVLRCYSLEPCRLLTYTLPEGALEQAVGYFRFQVEVVQRSRGDSAIRRAAYQTCRRMMAPNGREFDYSENYESHGHVQTIFVAPTGSPDWVYDSLPLWTNATLAERRVDAQEARKIEVSIPRALPRSLWEAFAREIVAPFISQGMVAQIDIHTVLASDGGINPHLHILLSMRRIVSNSFCSKKARDWNALFYNNATKLRAEIAQIQNDFCARHDVIFNADPRPNIERGLPAPEPQVPRWNFLVEKRTGRKTPLMEQRDVEKAARRRIDDLEASLAIVNADIEAELTRGLYGSLPPASPIALTAPGAAAANLHAKPYRMSAAPRPAQITDEIIKQHVEHDALPDTPDIEGSCPTPGL